VAIIPSGDGLVGHTPHGFGGTQDRREATPREAIDLMAASKASPGRGKAPARPARPPKPYGAK